MRKIKKGGKTRERKRGMMNTLRRERRKEIEKRKRKRKNLIRKEIIGINVKQIQNTKNK